MKIHNEGEYRPEPNVRQRNPYSPRGHGARFVKVVACLGYIEHCIKWPYGRSPFGYGAVRIGKRKLHAHRAVLIEATGVEHSHLHAAHSCGNAICVNPSHLRWATAEENIHDRDRHGTSNKGSRHGLAKLTELDVIEIFMDPRAPKVIASEFPVTYKTVNAIKAGRTWGHLTKNLTRS